MFRAVSEGSQAVSGTAAFLVIVGVIWITHRYERQKQAQAERAKRKAEIEEIVKSRPEDTALFREVLDDLGTDNTKKSP